MTKLATPLPVVSHSADCLSYGQKEQEARSDLDTIAHHRRQMSAFTFATCHALMVGMNDLEARFERHSSALNAARSRIYGDRRRMSLDDAVDIVRIEFQRHGVEASDEFLLHVGRMFHRGFAWPYLHPRRARREGYRFPFRRLR